MPAPGPIVFPAHALLIVEERLKEQEADGIRLPEGMPLDEVALRVQILTPLTRTRSTAPSARARLLPRGFSEPEGQLFDLLVWSRHA
jgi:hypothetical protein